MFKSALEYHDFTSYDRYDMKGHYMDWPNQPSVFKQYTGVERTLLSPPGTFQQKSLAKMFQGNVTGSQKASLDYQSFSALLHCSQALTAQARHGGSYFYYRSVASAGALYPFETYINVMNIDGLDPGLYHHNVAGNLLEKLHEAASADQLAEQLSLKVDPASGFVFFLTSIFFRSSWKYRDRAYRYHLLDTGHLLENLTLALKYYELDYQILFDFDDFETNRFLGLDTEREVCLVAVSVNMSKQAIVQPSEKAFASSQELAIFSRVSPKEVQYSAINDIHELTSNRTSQNASYHCKVPDLGLNLTSPRSINTPRIIQDELDYPDAVFQRRSLRNFVKKVVSSDNFNSILNFLGSSGDGVSSSPSHFGVGVGFLVSRVQGLDPGFYFYDDITGHFQLAKNGDLLDEMTHVCLDQSWLSKCAIHFLLMSNFSEVDIRFGPRGYRRAMITAGRLGQRLYIAATSLQLGCCGIGAFYDSEAQHLLGLNRDSRLAYLLGTGPIKRRNLDDL